jgi:MFS family permease
MNWLYISLAYLSLFFLGLADNVRGPLFPEILKAFSVTDTQGSWMFALSSTFGFIASFLSRHLLRKYDRVLALKYSIIGLSIALIAMAFVPSFSLFLTVSALFGFCLGLMGVVQNVLVSLGSTSERRRQMLAGLHSMYGLSSLLAPLVVAGVVALGFNWRVSLIVMAVFGVCLFVYSLWTPKNVVQHLTSKAVKEGSIKEHLPQIYLATMLGLYVMAEMLVSTRLALFMRRESGMDLEQSSLYITMFFIAMLAGRLLFTFLKLQTSLKKQLTVFLAVSILFFILGLNGSPIFLALTGFSMAPFYPLGVAYISEKFPEEIDSAIAYVMTVQSLLTVLMHVVVGWLTDMFGIAKAFYIGPSVLAISLFVLHTYAMFFTREQVRKRE